MRRALLLCALGLASCDGLIDDAPAAGDAAAGADAGSPLADGGDPGLPDAPPSGPDAIPPPDAPPPPPCRTRITYGDAWIHPAGHPAQHDVVDGHVTWDGACAWDGASSYATLSNGWTPYFAGRACVIALDHDHCDGAPTACATRLTYGDAWLHPDGHPAQHDDVAGRVTWEGDCTTSGAESYATLSNGWVPHFSGANACAIYLRYEACGGLYVNPVVPVDCPDPGVVRDGARYVVACTGFGLRTSTDLVSWTPAGNIFSAGGPTWAVRDFWAPELHAIGGGFVAYFTARHADGKLSIGAATATSATGPYTDIGAPLVHDGAMGMIDATQLQDSNGDRYLVWKADGNAVGQPTPIYGQRLTADGLALSGSRATLITNDRAWEGGVVEAPWVLAHGGFYYLFYSGNAYYNSTYAIGVARASAPLGPYTKAAAPILRTNGAWVGPGHNSTVTAPGGDTYVLYHAWHAGAVGESPGRVLLVDQLVWRDGWPAIPEAPSWSSRPTP